MSVKSFAERQRIVIETNVYIDWLNSGWHEEIVFAPGAVKHLSSVVMMELWAGAFAPGDRKLLQGVTRSFATVGRLLLPTIAVYQDAGEVLRRLQVVRGYPARGTATLVNDVLIALSARSIGAPVITQNKRDYLPIQGVRPFQLRVVT